VDEFIGGCSGVVEVEVGSGKNGVGWEHVCGGVYHIWCVWEDMDIAKYLKPPPLSMLNVINLRTRKSS